MTKPERAEENAWTSLNTPPAESLEMFAQARSRCPVAHSQGFGGFHMLLDYSSVKSAMADFRTFSSEPRVLKPDLPRPTVPALEMDPPTHGSWRALFNAAINPSTVSAMEPVIRADVQKHIRSFQSRGSCDIMEELCESVPAETICKLLGVDEDRVVPIRDASVALFAGQATPELYPPLYERFAEVALAEINERRRRPREDYITKLCSARVEGRPITDEEYVILLSAFLGAGHHSATSAMASLIYEVFSRPEVRDLLLADQSQIPIAVDETLRLHPPFFGFFRRVVRDTEIAGVKISAGEDVHMGWAAANRDPAVFECPESFRMDRGVNRHLSFGLGVHMCPGAPLARLELRIVIEELLKTLPDLTPISEPIYHFGGGEYCSLERLDVRFTPRSA